MSYPVGKFLGKDIEVPRTTMHRNKGKGNRIKEEEGRVGNRERSLSKFKFKAVGMEERTW